MVTKRIGGMSLKIHRLILQNLRQKKVEINKGIKNFEVKVINPTEYKEELFSVQVDAFRISREISSASR